MTRTLGTDRQWTITCMLLLAGVGLAAAVLDRRTDAIGEVAAALQATDLNREDTEEAVAGYYEALLDEGGRVRLMNPRLGAGVDVAVWGEGSVTRRGRDDFLLWDLRPNIHIDQLVTNSEGLADREYPHQRRPGLRRVVILGDSVTQGYGAKLGMSFEARLEDDLARHPVCPGQEAPEIINFGISGYKLTQLLDLIPSRARSFRPDAYVLALTQQSVGGNWSNHLTMLIREGRSLKYPFLADTVRQARVLPTDPQRTMHAKLARFRVDLIHESIREIKQMAASDHADFLVLLVPTALPQRELRKIFAGIPEILDSVGVPYVNLVGAFADVDVSTIRAGVRDIHPNTQGHALLVQALRSQLEHQRDARDAFLGASCRPAL